MKRQNAVINEEQLRVLEVLIDEGPLRVSRLTRKANISDSPIYKLYFKGMIDRKEVNRRTTVYSVNDYGRNCYYKWIEWLKVFSNEA